MKYRFQYTYRRFCRENADLIGWIAPVSGGVIMGVTLAVLFAWAI